jgi:hypothetical protein
MDSKNADNFEWKIADIDGFLSGNKFWIRKDSNNCK